MSHQKGQSWLGVFNVRKILRSETEAESKRGRTMAPYGRILILFCYIGNNDTQVHA